MLSLQEVTAQRHEIELLERAAWQALHAAHIQTWQTRRQALADQCPHDFRFVQAGVVPWVDWYRCTACHTLESRFDEECKARYDAMLEP